VDDLGFDDEGGIEEDEEVDDDADLLAGPYGQLETDIGVEDVEDVLKKLGVAWRRHNESSAGEIVTKEKRAQARARYVYLDQFLLTCSMTNFTPFSPKIPLSRSYTDKADIINHLKTRMVSGIYNNGKGYSVDRAVVDNEVNYFAERFFYSKNLHQLRLIEAIPSLTVTPGLMRACGFIYEEAQDETAVIYLKTVVGNKDSLDQMMKQGHEGSRMYATKLKAFLSDPTRPAHISDLPEAHLARDPECPTFYHIGRFISGVQARRKGENVSAFDTLSGDRPWTSAVYNSHGDHTQIQYWPLVDHSGLVGADWYRRMVRLWTPLL